jgi:hypothetical protein
VAADLTSSETTELEDPLRPEPTPAPQLRPARPHRLRFFVVYGVLALALGAGIAGVVIFAGRAIHPGPAWSSWKPHGGGLGAANEIAEHIASTYHLPAGQQLVDVIAKAPSVSPSDQTVPIHYIAIRGAKGQVDQVYPVSSSSGVMYSLCGLGQACSIATGKPSIARGTLVRREILELALYTFKYVGSVKDVIAFMPPTPGAQPTLAVYLQRSDLADQLNKPLGQTLSPKVPLPSQITAKEQEMIDSTTASRVYKFSLSQAQNGDAILVLSQLTA